MKVLITGSRNWTDEWAIGRALRPFLDEPLTIIHGDARGADRVADGLAHRIGASVYRFPAEWTRYGRAAGHIRNVEMLDTMRPDIVMAFPLPGSVGTWNCVREARRRRIPVRVEP